MTLSIQLIEIPDFEDTLTPNQWDLIEDIYNNSGGHMTVRDLVDHHGWSWSDINDLMPTLESLGVCAYDAIHTPSGSKSAIGLYRSTIAVLEDMEIARNTPEAVRIAELEAKVTKLESILNSRKDTLHHANKGFAEEREVFYAAIDTLESQVKTLEATIQQLATMLHKQG
jgi:outer membrane murein-binding lipoprotein Lpp